jgi:hypothetical protein
MKIRTAAARKSFGLVTFEDGTYGTVYGGFTWWTKDYIRPSTQYCVRHSRNISGKEANHSVIICTRRLFWNRMPIIEEELVEYIIDGIPDRALGNQARVSNAATREMLMARLSKWNRGIRKKR